MYLTANVEEIWLLNSKFANLLCFILIMLHISVLSDFFPNIQLLYPF